VTSFSRKSRQKVRPPHKGTHQRSLVPVQEDPEAIDEKSARAPVEITPAVTLSAWNEILSVIAAYSDKDRPAMWRSLASLFQNERRDIAAAATSLILADLHLQGWRMRVDGRRLWVIPPIATAMEGERAETAKFRLKNWLLAGRNDQIADPAVQAFITRMQVPRLFKDRRVSVLNLVDDGHSLSTALAGCALLPPSQRAGELARVIDPQLEVIDAQSTCNQTGLSLLDVWRFFRHTWSIEYRPTPGRSLFFLIRNAARPYRPVMAIGSLANATMQSRVREEWIGWSAARMRERIVPNPENWASIRSRLLATLASEITNIRADDLYGVTGDLKGLMLEKRLYKLADESKRLREHELRDRASRTSRGETVESYRRLPLTGDGSIAWDAAAETHLFRSKRAKTLADLLFAQRVLTDAETWDDTNIQRDEHVRAFSIACREVRKVGLATRLLELNVCGAVPPYRDLLVGKLAALAAASRELSSAYAARYGDKVSEISSQMAGRKVTRPSDICVIMTTSLYALSASQYNRLRINLEERNGRTRTIKWEELGTTVGYGTTHFSEDTVAMLRRVSTDKRGGRNVNNVFGEGQSPRLRQVREGLDDLGLASDGLLRHMTPRRVYALELFPGARDRLCLNEPAAAAQPLFHDLAAAWIDRWLTRRITFRPALDRVATVDAESVRRDLTPANAPQLSLFEKPPSSHSTTREPSTSRNSTMARVSNPGLIQSLYRASAACADHHDEATVELLHIETQLDGFIRRWAKHGGILFITGNPGDGKTHLLRRLGADLHLKRLPKKTHARLVRLIEKGHASRAGLPRLS
jgi:hypothetical protein